MKRFIQFSLVLALLATSFTSFAQKKIKEGVVKFEIVMEGTDKADEMAAMMAGSTLDFYFSADKQKMAMNMLGGMMQIQTFTSIKNPKDASMLMDMMGQKMHIVEMSEEEVSNANAFMNPDQFADVTYDEKDKKEIAGYTCYAANVKLKGPEGEEMTMKMYLTEKIIAPMPRDAKKSKVALKGYPLEFAIQLPGGAGAMTFRAKEVKEGVTEDDFKVPSGYTKMTMAEFQENMGGMDFNFGK